MKSIVKVLLLLIVMTSSEAFAEKFVVIVNKENRFKPRTDAKYYYLLRFEKWPEAGKVMPYDIKPSDDPSIGMARTAFIKKFLGFPSDGAFKEYWIQQKSKGQTRRPLQLQSFKDVVKYVKREKGGIGFVPISLAKGVRKVVKFNP